MLASKFTGCARRLLRSEDGGVMPLIGVACVGLIATMGLAIDAGRATIVYAKLLNSADASGLAVGARMSSTDLNAEAKKFVNANFPTGYAGATLKSVTATANASGDVITVKATAEMPTTLLRLVGVNSVDLKVTSEVTRAVSGLELVLALDNTGSMGNPASKLAGLKTASKDLIDIVFGDDDVSEDLFVGVVPFSQAVNIGPGRTGWLKTAPAADPKWSMTNWAGCVEARSYDADDDDWVADLDTTDTPPTTAATKFPSYYWPDEHNDDGSDQRYPNYYMNDWRDWDTTTVCTKYNKKGKCTTWGQTTVFDYDITSDKGPNKACPASVTGMTTSKATVIAAINNMKADGNTHINLGAVWGWRMLSPRWRGLWGGDMAANNLPLDYDTPRMNKAVVIMTDGENTAPSADGLGPGRGLYTAYGHLEDERLGSPSNTQAVRALDARLTTVCNNMKDKGILVFTVVFGSLDSDTEAMMKNCATQPDYYFSSPTAEQLKVSFRTIGDALANLRVSK